MIRNAFILVLASVFLAAGCSSTATKTRVSDSRVIQTGAAAYGILIRGDDGWHVAHRLYQTPPKPTKNSIGFDFSTLSPAGAPRKPILIWWSLLGGDQVKNPRGGYHEIDADAYFARNFGPFYKGDIHVGRTIFYNTIGLIFTAGFLAGSHDTNYTFDAEHFRQALDEGLSASHITRENRRLFFSHLERLDKLYFTRIGRIGDRLNKAIEKQKSIHYSVRTTVINKSGFKVPPTLVRVTPRPILFKRPSAKDIREYYRNAYYKSFGANFQRIKGALEDKLKAYESGITKTIAGGTYVQFECTPRKDYVVEYRCPRKRKYSASRDKIHLRVKVKAKAHVTVTFPNIAAHDSNISVRTKYGLMEISNNSNAYVNVHSLSLYWGGKIATLDGLNINMPPHSVKSDILLSHFDKSVLERGQPFELNHVSRAQLRRTSVNAGVAANYTKGGKELSVYNSKDMALADLL